MESLFNMQGAVGAEYASPMGKIFDFLAGEEPDQGDWVDYQGEDFPYYGPITYERFCYLQMGALWSVSRWMESALIAWGEGP